MIACEHAFLFTVLVEYLSDFRPVIAVACDNKHGVSASELTQKDIVSL